MPLAKHILCIIVGPQGCPFVISTRESGVGTGPKPGDGHFLPCVQRSGESPLHGETKACSCLAPCRPPGIRGHAHICGSSTSRPSSQAQGYMIKLWVLKSNRPGFKGQVYDPSAVHRQASHFTSLSQFLPL